QVNNNGWMAFDQALGAGFFGNAVIPGVASPNDAIFAWWDDLYLFLGSGGTVSYLVTPGLDLIVEWTGEGHFATPVGSHIATFQVVLHPSPVDTIELHYDGATHVAGAATTATIGVESVGASAYLDVTGLGAGNAAFPATDYTLALGPPPPPTPLLNYVATATTPAFSSIVGVPGEVVLLSSAAASVDDTTSPGIALPAPFSFFGVPKTTFQVNNNGWMAFDQALASGFFTNAVIPTLGAPNDAIFAWWDDLYLFLGSGGTVSYLVTPGLDLIVQWTTEGHFATPVGSHIATFQVVLHPSPVDTIELHYDGATHVAGASTTATIGVESVGATAGLDVTGLGTLNTIFPLSDYLLELCTPCGSTASFGASCPSTIGTAGGPPVGGNLAFAITQAGAAPVVPSLLILGFSNTTWVLPPAVPLPLPLGIFGVAGGCSLLVSPDVLVGTFTTAVGTSAVPIPIPLGVTPCGGVYAQWANVTSFAPLTILTSDGLLTVTL
ncbi:MAG: hypothetical protein L0323_03345, partial [Planctomycetes bacterium]|nr:hypothetical protein [Planctomycetota bacterium]